MINNLLHLKPVPLDRDTHRTLRVRLPVTDWSPAARLNALFVAAVEMADACREFPIVFVRAGNDEAGKPLTAPVAVFGLAQDENLFVQPDGSWRGHYQPAVLRLYPFASGRIDADRFAICVDTSYAGLGPTEGEALFQPDGQPTALTSETLKQIERIEQETQRTRVFCQRLQELDLLREMRFDATLPDGQKLAVDGFLVVDEGRVKALPDATLLELHKSGVLGLIHAHWISLQNMRRLVEWRVARLQADAAKSQASASAAAPPPVH